MPGLVGKRALAGTVTLDVGVYVIGGMYEEGSEFLPTRGTRWRSGPTAPKGARLRNCIVAVSSTSFLMIGGNAGSPLSLSIRQFEASGPDGPTANSGWKSDDTWPNTLRQARPYGHSCVRYGDRVFVVGSIRQGEEEKTTESIDLTTKIVSYGPKLVGGRRYLGLVTLGKEGDLRMLAFGGASSQGPRDTVEELGNSINAWKILPEKLSRKNTGFEYTVLTADMEDSICGGEQLCQIITC